MKIRLEKVEIEVSDDFIETIGTGLLRLKSFDAEISAREGNSRNSLLVSLIAAGFNMLREAMVTKSNGKTTTPTAPQAESDGEGAGESA